MTSLVLMLMAAGSMQGYAARCADIEQQVKDPSVSDEAALAAARDLGPPVVAEREGVAQLGRAPALVAAIEALDNAQGEHKKKARERLGQALDALCSVQSAAPAPVDRSALATILSAPDLQGRSEHQWALARLLERLWTLIKDFLQGEGFEGFSELSRLVFLAAVGLFVAVAGLRVWLSRRPAAVSRESDDVLLPRAGPSARDLRFQAEQMSAAGDPREALRLSMAALIRGVLESGLAPSASDASTNHEVAREVSQQAQLARIAEQLETLSGFFDRAYYGFTPVSRGDAQRFALDAGALQSSLPERSRRRPAGAAA